MILGFKTEIKGKPTYFPEKILACVGIDYINKYVPKKHSIRVGKRWFAGRKLHLSIGVRTKKYLQFNKNVKGLEVCKSVQDILIQHRGDHIYVTIDNKTESIWCNFKSIDNDFYSTEVDCPMIYALAKNDGFDSVNDFFRWFNTDFEGQIIHWTDLRY